VAQNSKMGNSPGLKLKDRMASFLRTRWRRTQIQNQDGVGLQIKMAGTQTKEQDGVVF